MRMRSVVGALALGMLLLCSVSMASADIENLTGALFLNGGLNGQACGSPCPGPYASIAIDLVDSTHVTFTFTGLNSPDNSLHYYFIAGPGGDVLGLSLLNTNVTSTVTADTPVGDGTLVGTVGPITPPGNVGSYNFYESSSDGKSSGSSVLYDNIVINFTLTSGSWDCIRQVGGTAPSPCTNAFLDNDVNFQSWIDGNAASPTFGQSVDSFSWAFGDMSACLNPLPTSGCNSQGTGRVGGAFTGTNERVPEPGTILLLGTGLIFGGLVVRRLKK